MEIINKSKSILLLVSILLAQHLFSIDNEYDGRHGWPVQKAPAKIIVCEKAKNFQEAMLLESLSGLAAQAVNNGTFNEMVWIEVDNESYRRIYQQTLEVLKINSVRKMNAWELLEYLKKRNVVKGYILYKQDKLGRNPYASYKDTDYSSNVATVYASLLKGVLIDESLEEMAKNQKLKLLKDARTESPDECFSKNKNKLNNHSALSIPPAVTNLRDYAIAQKLMLYADQKELIGKVLEWVEPLSPILGWGCGDEFDFTSVISLWGHYNTATNWCWNLPLISSVGNKAVLKKINEISLNEINFDISDSFHTFVMSDGDNVQWTMSNLLESRAYLGSPNRDIVNLTWTLCPVNLSVVSPYSWNAIAEVHNKNFTFLEYGGGYQYPDIFAQYRPNRLELVRKFAARMDYHFRQLGITVFGFICKNVASNEAQEAFQIYAEEIKGLTGMLAVQYFPYELEGQIYWKTNLDGIKIPVLTARYSIWNEVNPYRPRAGTPEFVASLINRDEIKAKESENKENLLTWTMVHSWSDFSKTSRFTEKPAIGVNPVKLSKEMLLDNIKCVSANELLWRIRMKYQPEQTEKLKIRN